MKVKARIGKKVKKTAPRRPTAEQPTRAARMLALAHYVERLIDAGDLKDYADAARRLGVTRARMTQIMNLLNLPVAVQDGILTGVDRRSERRLRAIGTGEAN